MIGLRVLATEEIEEWVPPGNALRFTFLREDGWELVRDTTMHNHILNVWPVRLRQWSDPRGYSFRSPFRDVTISDLMWLSIHESGWLPGDTGGVLYGYLKELLHGEEETVRARVAMFKLQEASR